MVASRCRCLVGLLVGLLLLAACRMPKVWIEDPLPPAGSPLPTTAPPPTTPPATTTPPPTTTPEDTPAPRPTRLPTPYASGRVTGQVCLAGVTVYLRSCCPPYEAREKSDASGFFAFEGLTEGTFTVSCGLYSEVVTLETYESQVDVDLCPPPTAKPGP
jgi:hypothetical protein